MKYVDTFIGLREIPDEITLCINISNCPLTCENCHSSYLRQNIGNELTTDTLKELLDQNSGISCVCFMGHEGLAGINFLNDVICLWIKQNYNIKIGVYSGFDLELKYTNFDFIKTGKYDQKLGPINKITTNQRLYQYHNFSWIDITDSFWVGWKYICDNKYIVSTKGKVFSLISKKYLAYHKTRKGYYKVWLYDKYKKRYMAFVHRLVAQCFLPNYSAELCVNHKDENKTNNSVENLEMCTITYNNTYGSRLEKALITKSKSDKLRHVLQYSLNGTFIAEYKSAAEAGKSIGKSGNLIRCCCDNKIPKYRKYPNKTAYGYIWKYK